jgi:hypothetical protein
MRFATLAQAPAGCVDDGEQWRTVCRQHAAHLLLTHLLRSLPRWPAVAVALNLQTHPVGEAAELMQTEAVQMLEEMREHTRRLEQARGIWCASSSTRQAPPSRAPSRADSGCGEGGVAATAGMVSVPFGSGVEPIALPIIQRWWWTKKLRSTPKHQPLFQHIAATASSGSSIMNFRHGVVVCGPHRDKRGAPGGVRDHNEFRIDANKDKPALPDASLAAYKQHKAEERTGHTPKLLGTGCSLSTGDS